MRRNRNILFHEIGHLVCDDREDLVVEWRALVGRIPPTVDERELFAHQQPTARWDAADERRVRLE